MSRSSPLIVVALGSLYACAVPPPEAFDRTPGTPAGGPEACRTYPFEGDVDLSVESGGEDRPFILHVPPDYDGNKPLPLLLVLHGFGGNAEAMVAITGFSCRADTEGFLVAYLNGTTCDPDFDEYGDDPGCVNGQQRAWNNGLTPSLGITADDVQFVRDLLAYLDDEYRIDHRRVYAAGLSNGGMMTHVLAAALPDVLAGAMVVEGVIGRDPNDGTFVTIPDATGSTPMLIIHGTEDEAIGYYGDTGELCPCTSVDDAVEYWLDANRCHGPSKSLTEGEFTTTTWGGCRANSDVTLIALEGGHHQWQSNATDAAWSFFARRPLTTP